MSYNSFNSYKNDKASYFFNYNDTPDIVYKSLKNHSNYFCTPLYSYNNNSHLNIESHDVLPKNSYPSTLSVNGEKIDFDIPMNELLHYKVLLSFDLKNEHDTVNLTIIASTFFIEKLSILKNGNTIVEYDDYYQYFKNLEKFNLYSNAQYFEDFLGIDKSNYNTVLPIDLFFSLRKSNIFLVYVRIWY